MFGMSKAPAPARREAKQPAPEQAPQAASRDEAVPAQITLSVTPTQRAKLERLGGAKWLISQIENAKTPPR
jgi:hypothetical protein